jgi:uncharacterized membrane protein
LTDNVAGALCYFLGLITGILFLVLEPYSRNKTIRFHAFQSIFLNLCLIAFWIVYSIILGVMLTILPYAVWHLVHLVNMVVWLAFMVLWVMLMLKAYQNQRLVIPIIGPLAEKQA